MEALELVLFLLAAVVASSILEKLLPRLSLPLVQIALGALIAAFVATPLESGLDPELLLILFIAPLHFNESRHADSGALWANRWGIASLAVGLVFAIVASLGFTLHALLPMIPLSVALALGAAMGSTDAVAVTSLSRDLRFGRRHEALLTGEALFNDVTGTVVFQCCIAVAVSGTFSIVHAGEEFALDLFGGLIGGAIMGLVAWLVLELIRRGGIDGPTLHVTLELLLPFIIYLAAKQLHIGAVIAVVAAGMVMSLLPHRHSAQTARQKLQSRSVWHTIEFVLNGVIFVILGMQLPRVLRPAAEGGMGDPLAIVGIMVALTLVLEAIRFLWIVGMDAVEFRRARKTGDASDQQRRFLTKAELKGALAMAFAGPKGGITLSLMLTVPSTLAAPDGTMVREALVSIASGVILLTLLLANFATPLLAPHKREATRTRERVDAEIELIERVIDSIEDDAHMTGAVRGENAVVTEEGADEPATVIVMERYAAQLKELMPHASPPVAAHAKTVAARCDELYGSIAGLAREVTGLSEDADEDEDGPADASPITAHFRAVRQTYDAVENIQAQALVRELEFIQQLRTEGAITPSHAKELRNDVYIQQLALD